MFARLQAEWRLKLLLFLGVNAFFWPGYQWLARHAFFPLREAPVVGLDHTVSFQPEFWSWVYLSQFILTGSLPLLLTTREAIRRYVTSLAIISVTSFAVFFFCPTAAPRRPEEIGDDWAMRFIVQADGPLNAFPSLHAAFLVCAGRIGIRMFGARALPVILPWGGAILYSTLATKQHYALDLLAGGALGWLADWLAWRRASAEAIEGTPIHRDLR